MHNQVQFFAPHFQKKKQQREKQNVEMVIFVLNDYPIRIPFVQFQKKANV